MEAFREGLVIFFRTLTPLLPGQTEAQLARSVHPNGRDIEVNRAGFDNDYIVTDEEGTIIGIYPREWVAAIIPISTRGPADAENRQADADHPSEAEAGNPQGKPRRTSRLNN